MTQRGMRYSAPMYAATHTPEPQAPKLDLEHKHFRHNTFEGCTTYATYENAMKKLDRELKGIEGVSRPQTMISVTPDGRFVPVAVGHDALRLGLHFRGIVVVG